MLLLGLPAGMVLEASDIDRAKAYCESAQRKIEGFPFGDQYDGIVSNLENNLPERLGGKWNGHFGVKDGKVWCSISHGIMGVIVMRHYEEGHVDWIYD